MLSYFDHLLSHTKKKLLIKMDSSRELTYEEIKHTENIYRHYIPILMNLIMDGKFIKFVVTPSGEELNSHNQIAAYFCTEHKIHDVVGKEWINEWLCVAMAINNLFGFVDFKKTFGFKLVTAFMCPNIHYYGEDTLPNEWYNIPNIREYVFMYSLTQQLKSENGTRPLVQNIKILRTYIQRVRSDGLNFNNSHCINYVLFSAVLVGSDQWDKHITITSTDVFVSFFDFIIEPMLVDNKIDPLDSDLMWFLGFIHKPDKCIPLCFRLLTHSQCASTIELALDEFTDEGDKKLCIKLQIGSALLYRNYHLLYYDLIRKGCISADMIYINLVRKTPYQLHLFSTPGSVETLVSYQYFAIQCAQIVSQPNSEQHDIASSLQYIKSQITPSLKLALSKLPLPIDIILYISEMIWQVYTPDIVKCTITQSFIRRLLKEILVS